MNGTGHVAILVWGSLRRDRRFSGCISGWLLLLKSRGRRIVDEGRMGTCGKSSSYWPISVRLEVLPTFGERESQSLIRSYFPSYIDPVAFRVSYLICVTWARARVLPTVDRRREWNIKALDIVLPSSGIHVLFSHYISHEERARGVCAWGRARSIHSHFSSVTVVLKQKISVVCHYSYKLLSSLDRLDTSTTAIPIHPRIYVEY